MNDVQLDFIGFVEGNNDLYASLQLYGYVLIFKPTFRNRDGKVKGNCDAELVLQAMIDLNEYRQAVIVSGDGDFYCLVGYLRKIGKLPLDNVCVPGPNVSSAFPPLKNTIFISASLSLPCAVSHLSLSQEVYQI